MSTNYMFIAICDDGPEVSIHSDFNSAQAAMHDKIQQFIKADLELYNVVPTTRPGRIFSIKSQPKVASMMEHAFTWMPQVAVSDRKKSVMESFCGIFVPARTKSSLEPL